MPAAATKRKTTTRKTSARKKPTTPTAVAERVPEINVPKGANYTVRTGVPVISEQQYNQQFEQIQGQMRATKIAQENAKLDREQLVIEELNLATELQGTKNLIAGEKVVAESVKLNQWQQRSELERVKLRAVQIDVDGERALLQPKQELQDIRLEGTQIDVDGSRSLLKPQKEKWALQLEMAELKLQEMRGQIQRQRAQLGTAPLSIEQLD
ncbi:MAG: hypothetical protein AAGE59_26015 [Cyanobacteria bacterium P01_F01_bin.86]